MWNRLHTKFLEYFGDTNFILITRRSHQINTVLFLIYLIVVYLWITRGIPYKPITINTIIDAFRIFSHIEWFTWIHVGINIFPILILLRFVLKPIDLSKIDDNLYEHRLNKHPKYKIRKKWAELKIVFIMTVVFGTVGITVYLSLTQPLILAPLHAVSTVITGWWVFFGIFLHYQKKNRNAIIDNINASFNNRFGNIDDTDNRVFTRDNVKEQKWDFRNGPDVRPSLTVNPYTYYTNLKWLAGEYPNSLRDTIAQCEIGLPKGFHLSNEPQQLFQEQIDAITNKEWDYDWNWPSNTVTLSKRWKLPTRVVFPADMDHGLQPFSFPIAMVEDTRDIECITFGRIPNAAFLGTSGFGKGELIATILYHAACVNMALNRVFWQVYLLDPTKGSVDFAEYKDIPGFHLSNNFNDVIEYAQTVEDHRHKRQQFIIHKVFDEGYTKEEATAELFERFGVILAIFDEWTFFTAKTGDKETDKLKKQTTATVAQTSATGRATGNHYILASQEISKDSFPQWVKNNFSYRVVGYMSQGGSLVAMGTTQANSIDQHTPGRGYMGTVGNMRASQNILTPTSYRQHVNTWFRQYGQDFRPALPPANGHKVNQRHVKQLENSESITDFNELISEVSHLKEEPTEQPSITSDSQETENQDSGKPIDLRKLAQNTTWHQVEEIQRKLNQDK